MSKLLSCKEISIHSSTSPIEYKRAGYRQRFLTIEGKEIANTGIDCETCLFYADSSGMDMKNATRISNKLNQGINTLDQDFMSDLSCLIPNGHYIATLLKVYPRMKREAYGTEYYKAGLRNISSLKKIEEYIVPIQPSESLNPIAINDYKDRVNVKETPTALSISFLDIKYPLNHYDEVWVYSHFLLDGHHKMFAADKAQKAVTLLSFLSIEESFANKEHLEKLFQVLT
ncbi:hypothetical protein [Brevibacillus sp. BC25]|uniref:hypothetical protein n=1 Tax=Brevibacillus sp. BC25 TaxID=1144308 RepID=UPI000271129E|nr:hypothetical protein [Brevibacillus sp. BC25]EJL28694.1 hypothetical protein PMI05_02095 [Brevibacillus sp. BC25]